MPSVSVPRVNDRSTSATVLRWLKKPGESVARGDLLAILEVEDAFVHLEAAAAGRLGRVLVDAGRTAKVGAELAQLDSSSSSSSPEPLLVMATSSTAAATQAATATGTAVPILMPQAGNSMEEGKIIAWKVSEGETIKAGQVICEIETDKASIEYEAPEGGRLAKIVAAAGETVKVKEPIAYLGEGPVLVSSPAPAPAAAAPIAAPVLTASSSATPILMPQAGNSMEEGRIVAWKVKVGDRISVGQIICEIETDKATIEYESPEAGRLAKIVTPDGEVAKVKEPIAYLSEGDVAVGGSAASAPAAPAPARAVAAAAQAVTQAVAAATPAVVSAEGRVKASPAARKIAAEKGINLASVGAGSGPGGRILSTDLDRVPARAAASAPVPAARPAVSGSVVRKPMSKMRKAIATNLQKSKQTVPHFYVRNTIVADPLFSFYRQQKPLCGCTVNDCIVLAVARTMRDFPAVRSQVDGTDIVEFPNANIGVAVGVDDGLVVPVILNVDTLSLGQLAAETKRIVENARKGKLENVGKGNFTISNLGMFGVEEFAAIINPPESGILAVSALREDVIVKDGAMRPGRVMTLTLSADHRIVDGLLAAQFMQKLKETLENPAQLAQ